ncbi:MAG: ABC transporter ATP-binding protein, partial [Phormidesmis sp.]
MDLIVFLVRSAWQAVSVALVTGFISGGCSAGLIALISVTVVQRATPPGGLAIAFIVLGLVALITAA